MNSRAVAAKLLADVIRQQGALSDEWQANSPLEAADRALVGALTFGVCRWYFRLQPISRVLIAKPLKDKDSDIHALVLIGLYQLTGMRVPAHAAINETVQAARDLGKKWACGFINATLRRFQREQAVIESELAGKPAFDHAHPKWLLSKLQEAWPEHWQAICEANNTQAPMCLRVNQANTSRVDYLSQLEAADIGANECEWAPQGVRLETPMQVQSLPGFAEAQVSVQDESAQLTAELMNTTTGHRVLDACAAPGGKSCHLLEQGIAAENFVPLEKEASRLPRIQENFDRLKFKTEPRMGDATRPAEWWDGIAFDRILIDAPCSGTGVIRRHPDIKLTRRAQDIVSLAKTQLDILESLWPLLRVGGQLLYATCSVLPEENDQVVSAFLSKTPDAQVSLIEANWGIKTDNGRQLLPQINGHDGFYYARINKSEPTANDSGE